jgi:GntR family transcriptional regulator, transcriptional repressor for pyruvate dehydrogenase complex
MNDANPIPDLLTAIQEDVRRRTEAAGNRQRRYELLADALRDRILSGELKEGASLPGERDFVAMTGLGRGSVREAIRILESEGLLSPKSPGRYGQSVVQPAPDSSVHRQLELFVRGASISSVDLIETRLALEPTLARLAARNRDAADIARLRAVTADMAATDLADRRRLKQLNSDWHVAVARASHNELLTAIMIGVSNAHDMANALERYGDDSHSRLMIAAHERILAAIEDGDEEAAMRRMARHLDAYSRTLAQHLPEELSLDREN